MRRFSSLEKHHKEFIIGIDDYKSLSFCLQKEHRFQCFFFLFVYKKNEDLLIPLSKNGSLILCNETPILLKFESNHFFILVLLVVFLVVLLVLQGEKGEKGKSQI